MTGGHDEHPAGARADGSAAPAGTSGEQFRATWKKARTARGKARRRAAGRYVRQADRAAGGQWRPGMGRRTPELDGDDAA